MISTILGRPLDTRQRKHCHDPRARYEGYVKKFRGALLVEALCYEPEGRRFEIRRGEWLLTIYLFLSAALDPGLYRASNRNEYRRQK
jgi:hypothetical protein